MDDEMKPITDLLPKPAHRPIREALTPAQERYAFLKCTTNLTQMQIADQLGVHYNTLTNWNRSPLVKQAFKDQIEGIRTSNMLGMQRLMGKMIEESVKVLDSDVGTTIKVQLIGQLFTQAGKMSGLEPPKEVKKKVTVEKSFEQLISDEIDYEIEDVD
jgi:hypothetical protein